MEKLFAVVAVVAMLLMSQLSAPRADPKKAAEFFALAEAAEKRSDWTVAIKNYQLAYEQSPHADVLFNIALNYERLGRNRDAGRFLTQFAESTKDGAEKRRAEKKHRELRDKPSKVSFTSEPADAEIFVDGKRVGQAPLELELPFGNHVATSQSETKQSKPRKFRVEYGEPLTIDLRIGAGEGLLTVRANIRDADVMIDGVGVGKVPFTGKLAAGTHTVLVSKAGYRTISRDIVVPADGSEQISAQMTAIEGGAQTASAPKAKNLAFLMGMAFGGSGGSDAQASTRFLGEIGLRTRTRRFDFVGTYGTYGERVGVGYGGAMRLYLRGGLFRPYIRTALLYGSADDGNDGKTGSLAFEGGAGLRYIGSTSGHAALEYFVEINFQVASADIQRDREPGPGLPEPLLLPTAGLFLSFPVTVGLAYRFGGQR